MSPKPRDYSDASPPGGVLFSRASLTFWLSPPQREEDSSFSKLIISVLCPFPPVSELTCSISSTLLAVSPQQTRGVPPLSLTSQARLSSVSSQVSSTHEHAWGTMT